MSLGTATVFKNSNVLTVIHLAFLRKDTGDKSSDTEFGPQ